jgi:hypothetical protein
LAFGNFFSSENLQQAFAQFFCNSWHRREKEICFWENNSRQTLTFLLMMICKTFLLSKSWMSNDGLGPIEFYYKEPNYSLWEKTILKHIFKKYSN